VVFLCDITSINGFSQNEDLLTLKVPNVFRCSQWKLKSQCILVILIRLIGQLPLQIETNYPLTDSTRSRPFAVLPCVEPHSRAE
jgi:hypothetical protein